MKFRFAIAFYFAILLNMNGCTNLEPNRITKISEPTSSNDPCQIIRSKTNDKDKTIDGTVDKFCEHQIIEKSNNYRLYFSEFDDQGWLYPPKSEATNYDQASEQIKIVSKDLEELLNNNPAQRVSVIVFAHGWKHSAKSDDNNVKAFRRILDDIGAMENKIKGVNGCPRTIIGIYIGWRGSIIRQNDSVLENISFWDRKAAAERVAQGEVRTLFAKLKSIQKNANLNWNTAVEKRRLAATNNVEKPLPINPCDKRMRVTYTGHSFGGLVIYTSLSQQLIQDVVQLSSEEATRVKRGAAEPLLESDGDMVVVINPAFEATRFAPLFNAAQDANFSTYHMPLFVSITSGDDKATDVFFAAGRRVGTLFENYPKGSRTNERQANLNTLGHTQDFRTHELHVLDEGAIDDSKCVSWQKTTSDRLLIENKSLSDYRDKLRQSKYNVLNAKDRYFCGEKTMKLSSAADGLANSPVWNIFTNKPIIENHNDFENPLLLDFLRQLYLESDNLEFKQELQLK